MIMHGDDDYVVYTFDTTHTHTHAHNAFWSMNMVFDSLLFPYLVLFFDSQENEHNDSEKDIAAVTKIHFVIQTAWV